MAFANLVFSAAATLVAYGVWRLLKRLLHPYRSPIRDLPGPRSPSFIYGSLKQIFKADPAVQHEKWAEEFGTTYRYRGFFGSDRLYTMDPRAINHILTHSMDYPKPDLARKQLGELLGEGLLVAEGDVHRNQRRIINPAFGPAQIRELTGIFFDKSAQLRDVWQVEVDKMSGDAPARINVLSWLSRATLDNIGLAGFNYRFEALNSGDKRNELNEAFTTIFTTGQDFTLLPILKAFIPPLRVIPSERDRTIKRAQATMSRIGLELIEDKKAAVRAEKDGRHVEKDDVQGRDLLSLLVRANMAVDLPDLQRLSDKDMLAQIPTFLVAGHETTSTGTTWALFALAQDAAVQSKLRAELRACASDAPDMDTLQALPYLDAVVRETLRLHAPVSNSIRVVTKDDVIPLAEPFIDRHGVTRHQIPVIKGDSMFIPILAINRAKHIWGPDAHEFRPERWLEPTSDAVSNIPGVWGNMLTFLGGPHACIGYRFTLVEMKALLFTLVRELEFELAVPVSEIKKITSVVTRPVLASEQDKGSQLPLLVRRYQS